MSDQVIYTEKELLLRIAAGDQQAYQVLFDKYWDSMYANALHFTKQPELAQDLTQEIFIKVWMMRQKLPEVKQFDSFLFTVAKNRIVDELRRLHSSPQYDDFFDAYFQIAEDSGIGHTELKDLEKSLHKAIERLPQQMQTAFKLSRFEGLTHEQIAKQMNISRITSQNYIARAIVSIRKYLDGQQIELILVASFLFSK